MPGEGINRLGDRILRIGYEATLGRRLFDDELRLLLQNTSDEIKKASVKFMTPPIPNKNDIEKILFNK